VSGAPHLRVARPTDNLGAVVAFYRDGLGLRVIGEFHDHDGFDGVMLGREDAPYHFEFTQKRGHEAGRAPTEDNLIVFYIPDEAEWKAQIARVETAGHQPVRSFNPYWDRQGRTYEDPDGYRIVIWHGAWRG
jgi:catechol 2,3-dioxygenase-like lactoylglutathione lyase family enzyme